ncbi:ABC transporter, permease protein [Thermacetogenium phaeum DSM 12270]|uniref:ABC transporter, permease protein n=1 Tax=Thermacetogenium phaeum (strain ATCC BAA-254 / DSM 26808 / PB) TaxID=1089553 RepID=K4LCE2_THEPS|nr:iron ABC transporter permease [Thermacetogenium phaeum]AFV10403.1 ABC transporter, permease protein [Thermacetogenium phaeum DSM 12270]
MHTQLVHRSAVCPRRLKASAKLILALLLVTVFVFSIVVGRYPITIPELLSTVYSYFFGSSMGHSENLETVIFNVRLPRVITAMVVGAALSIAGASYQGMFKNPLVSPDILGASAGAGFGAALAILFSLSVFMIQLSAFVWGALAVMLVYLINTKLINTKLNYEPTLGLVLSGILISSLFSSGTAAIKYIADANDKLPEITFWLMGSLSAVDKRDLLNIIFPMVAGFLLLFLVRWRINILAFGEEEARALGINTQRLRMIIILGSTLITAASVSVSGMIGWVGLVIPHLARAVAGPNYETLIPVTFIIGASYLLLVDDLARCLGAVEVPLGILTSLLGVPVFLIVLRKNIAGWR